MKIKTISRSADDHIPTPGAPPVLKRNLDPNLHPFQRAREYNRALTASKLDRMFAKPFVGALEGHVDGVYCSAKDPRALGCVASGSGDGQVIVWSLSSRLALSKVDAHKSQVADVCFASGMTESSIKAKSIWGAFAPNGDEEDSNAMEDDHQVVRRSARVLSCSNDKTIKLWSTVQEGSKSSALKTWTGRNGFK